MAKRHYFFRLIASRLTFPFDMRSEEMRLINAGNRLGAILR